MIRLLLTAALFWSSCALSLSMINEQRYCTTPSTVARDVDGKILRSRAVIQAFRMQHACPVTGLSSGPCSGWSVDHVIPLECGGCDSVNNMQWLPNAIKSAPGVLPKDRWERSVYCPQP